MYTHIVNWDKKNCKQTHTYPGLDNQCNRRLFSFTLKLRPSSVSILLWSSCRGIKCKLHTPRTAANFMRSVPSTVFFIFQNNPQLHVTKYQRSSAERSERYLFSCELNKCTGRRCAACSEHPVHSSSQTSEDPPAPSSIQRALNHQLHNKNKHKCRNERRLCVESVLPGEES